MLENQLLALSSRHEGGLYQESRCGMPMPPLWHLSLNRSSVATTKPHSQMPSFASTAYLRRFLLRHIARFLALGCLLAVSMTPIRAQANPNLWAAAASTDTLVLASGQLTLAPNAAQAAAVYGSYTRFGMFDSAPQSIAPANQVTVTWGATVPVAASVRVDVRGFNGQRWSDWTLAVQSGQTVAFASIARQIQYRLVLLANEAAPVVDFVQLAPNTIAESDAIRIMEDEPIAPTYHIRATRMGLVGDRTANGHIIQPNDWFVSLPSFRSLSSRGGGEYMARLSYRGKSIVVPVWEVGPWNIHDDYWNVEREKFGDLPVGWPQDHAAYFDGYNGGWAEKGRVRFPTAADVGDGAWVALGIPFNDEQEELDITFLWLGRDPGDNPEPMPVGSVTPEPAPIEELPAGTIQVDNQSEQFSRSDVAWYEFSCGKNRHSFWTFSTNKPEEAVNNARWTTPLEVGEYSVTVFVPYCPNGKSDTTSARYVVQHADGETQVVVNQAEHAGNWVELGRYRFDGTGSVSLSDLADDRMKAIWFDSVRWTK